MVDFINVASHKWKVDLINNTFRLEIALKILRISLVKGYVKDL